MSEDNIWNKNLEEIYKQTEGDDSCGYYPVGSNDFWHSGIHLDEEYVYPIMDGEIIAYRQYDKLEEIPKLQSVASSEFKKYSDNEKLFYKTTKYGHFLKDNSYKDQISINFYLIKHTFLENKHFYSLYFNLCPDNVFFSKFNEKITSSFIDYKDEIGNIKLPFTKRWEFQYLFNSNKDISIKSLKNNPLVFPGSSFYSILSISLTDYFNDKININGFKLSPSTELKNLKKEYLNIKNFDVKSNTIKKLIKIDNKFLGEKDYKTINCSEITTPITLNGNMLQNNNIIISLVNSNISKTEDNPVFDKIFLLPIAEIEEKKDGDKTKPYSLRDSNIYKIRNDKTFTIENCPLELENVDLSNRIIDNTICLLSEKEYRKLNSNQKMKFNYHKADTNLIISESISEKIEDENIDSINSTDSPTPIYSESINQNGYVFVYLSNTSDEQKRKIKIFVNGEEYVPQLKEASLNEIKKILSNETIQIDNKINVYKVYTVSIYKDDTFKKEDSSYYSLINTAKKYVCCKYYLQETVKREYEIENNGVEIMNIDGRLTQNLPNSMLDNNKSLFLPLYDSNDYSKNEVVKIITTNNSVFMADIDKIENSDLNLSNIELPGDSNKYYSKVNKKQVKIKLSDRKDDTSQPIIKKSNQIEKCNIQINSSTILGYPMTETKYKVASGKERYFDVNLFLEKNFITKNEEQKGTDKNNYYFYSSYPKDTILYEKKDNPTKIFLPADTELNIDLKSFFTENKKIAYKMEISKLPVYVDPECVERNSIVEIKQCPDYINLSSKNSISISAAKSQYLVEQFYKTFSKAIQNREFTSCECTFNNNLRGIFIDYYNKGVRTSLDYIWVKADYLEKIVDKKLIISKQNFEITKIIENFQYYSEFPLSGGSYLKYCYIPMGTVCIYDSYQLTSFGMGFYKIGIRQFWVFIEKKYLSTQYYSFKKIPKRIILYNTSHTVTKDSKEDDLQCISKNFYSLLNEDKIKKLKLECYDEKTKNFIGVYLKPDIFRVVGIDTIPLSSWFWIMDKNLKYTLIYDLMAGVKLKENSTFNVYPQSTNPTYLYYDEVTFNDNKEISWISNEDEKDQFKNSYNCITLKNTESNKIYYIPKKNADNYRTSALNWPKFFTYIKGNNKKIDKEFDSLLNEMEFTDEEKQILESYNKEEKKNNKQYYIYKDYKTITKSIVDKFRTLSVTHLHELDNEPYNTFFANIGMDTLKNYYNNYTQKAEIVPKLIQKGIISGETCKNNLLTFVNPIYFMNHLKTAGMFEFNPYEGKTYQQLALTSDAIDFSKTHSKDSVVHNPGFAPYIPDATEANNTVNSYAKINAFFLQDMGGYLHEGIDFYGVRKKPSELKTVHTPIHSLITGVVIRMDDYDPNNYGKHIMISDGKDRIFLLGHLCDYADGIQVGSHITPKMIVGYVGNTGNCISNTPKSEGGGTHLHVSVYITQYAKEIVTMEPSNMSGAIEVKLHGVSNNGAASYSGHSCKEFAVVNPFNYNEKRT